MKNNIKKHIFLSLLAQVCLFTISGQEIENLSNSSTLTNKDNEKINHTINRNLTSYSQVIDVKDYFIQKPLFLNNIIYNENSLFIKEIPETNNSTLNIIDKNINIELIFSLLLGLFLFQFNKIILLNNKKYKDIIIIYYQKVISLLKNSINIFFIYTLSKIRKLYYSLYKTKKNFYQYTYNFS